MTTHYKCFFCEQEADRIIFYSKYYPPSNQDTIENPTFCCPKCWANGTAKEMFFKPRGGMECIAKYLFEDIGQWNRKQIGRHLSNKGYEINHLANKMWRKILWHIHYCNMPVKRRLDDAPGISSEL